MFHGSMVALVTPMLEDTQIDYPAMAKLIEWHIESGTDALIVCGSTGEAAMLTLDEKRKLIAFVVRETKQRIPVIAGSHADSTREAIELTRMSMEQGADACLIMTPAIVKPTQEGLVKHYSAIADAVAIPQIVYNVPGRTQCDLLPETMAKLASKSNIIGIKEASGKLERIAQIRQLCGDRIDIYSGEDAIGCESVLHGAKGVISVTANVAPRLMAEMIATALKGDAPLAHERDALLQPLHHALFVESNPIPAKWALHQMGKIGTGIRLPLTTLSTRFHSTVRDAIAPIIR
jgi:4-hydroxy-tetrahydrodipicolinate synthase